MSQYTFSYKLAGSGWADASVSADESGVAMTVSYLSDALGDLARAIIALFAAQNGCPMTCSWEDEPGEYRWVMRREGETVHLQIVKFDDTFSRKDNEKGQPFFETNCTLPRLATQVRGQMRQLLNDFGEEGYKERWVNHDFPMQELLRLDALITENRVSNRL